MKIQLLILCMACSLLTGCAVFQPKIQSVVILSPKQDNSFFNQLDINFLRVEVIYYKPTYILDYIGNSINNAPQEFNFRHFGYGLDVTRLSVQEEKQLINKKISIKLKNVTLREVLDDFCAKTGWTYKESIVGYTFDITRQQKQATTF